MWGNPDRRFRPRLGPSVAALGGIALLIGLGTWQVQRLHWKQDLIAVTAARTSAAPIALPADLSDPALEYRPVRLSGHYRHDKELYLAARTHRGRPGLHVVTPLRLDDGRAVLVDRGWVPPERKDPASRAAGQVEGAVTVDGRVRRGGWRGMALFRPGNQPGDNLWLWPDLPAMTAHAGLDAAVTDVYVAAGPAAIPGGYPLGAQVQVDLSNNHLRYALTWYALAVALLVIYVLHQRRPQAKDPDDAGL